MIKLVPEDHATQVEAFIVQYYRVTGQLRALVYRASCPQLIKYNAVRGSVIKYIFFNR
jgi:hypothetical protein